MGDDEGLVRGLVRGGTGGGRFKGGGQTRGGSETEDRDRRRQEGTNGREAVGTEVTGVDGLFL